MDNNKMILAALAALAVAGCSDDKANVRFDTATFDQRNLHYTYPLDNQQQIAPRTIVALQFSHTVSASPDNFTFTGPEGAAVPFGFEILANGKGVVLTPEAELATDSDYTVTMSGVTAGGEAVDFPDGELNFTTRAALVGAVNARRTSSTFEVESIFPDGEMFKTMDFSSFFLRATQPIDQTSVNEATVTLSCDGATIPVNRLVKHSAITVDPVDDLPVGASCELLVDGVTNENGEAIAPFSHAAVPQDTTSPLAGELDELGNPIPARAVLGLNVPGANDCMSPSGDSVSQLSGLGINCVQVNSTLLADQTVSGLSGELGGELAHLPNFPDVSPLRIKKGTVLKGAALEVLVGGHVKVPWNSGEVLVEVISDATGYLFPNPNADSDQAPKNLVVFMDAAFGTGDPRANGAFTQNVLHLQLVGQALIADGQLSADALTVVEPRVLGVEDAWGVLSFNMSSLLDQSDYQPAVDSTAPFIPELDGVLSWLPGAQPERAGPNDPIVVNFSEMLDPRTINGINGESLTLSKDGVAEPFTWELDGTSLIIRPDAPLAYNASYEVGLNGGITDLSANPLSPYTLSVTMPPYTTDDGENLRRPFLTGLYPGFPCRVDTTDASFDGSDGFDQNDVQGTCETFHNETAPGDPGYEPLPIEPLPANRAITIRFSQNMVADSLINGITVQELDASGAVVGPVEGVVTTKARQLQFTPNDPWVDGTLYSFTLASDAGTGGIHSVDGLGLQTSTLNTAAPTGDMTVLFHGAPASSTIFQPLGNLPRLDSNANLALDTGEMTVDRATLYRESGYVFANDIPDNSTILQPGCNNGGTGADCDGASGNFLVAANIGCGFNNNDKNDPEQCDDQKLLYITADLNVEITNYDAEAPDLDGLPVGGVPVTIYTNQAMLGNLHAVALLGLSIDNSGGGCSSIPILGGVLCDLLNTATGIATIPVEVDTGANVMRIRYVDGKPPVGVIYTKPGEVDPVFAITLDLLFDAPDLEVLGGLAQHNVKDLVIPDVKLEGPVEFLPDGRLYISLLNRDPLNVSMEITMSPRGVCEALLDPIVCGLLPDSPLEAGDVNLVIPANGINLSYQSPSIK